VRVALRRFPFDKIKIDKSFIRDLTHAEGGAAIIRTMAGLGTSLSLTTTAEGVETREQLAILRDEGCTEVRGYLFSRPVPSSEIPALLDTLSEPPYCSTEMFAPEFLHRFALPQSEYVSGD
jgi:EAL domain-containing protein (putative c-di-GMP-specific phosphodiesterase class I)